MFSLFIIPISAILMVTYALMALYALFHWKKAKIVEKPSDELSISVIVPFRNEEGNLPSFLKSLRQQVYPRELIELIAIDDHSEDGGIQLIREFASSSKFKVVLIELDDLEEGKKEALEKGIRSASNEIIVTTDADTERGENWLRGISGAFEDPKTEMLISPVKVQGSESFLQAFQRFEFNAFQLITFGLANAGKPVLCNGTNLAYRKKTFEEIGGFSRFAHLSSGDDLFLMLELKKKRPTSIRAALNLSTSVSTPACQTIGELFAQKVRWASKSIHVVDRDFALTALLMTAVNVWVIFLPFLEFSQGSWPVFSISCLCIKFIADYLMISRVSHFHSEKMNMAFFLISFMLYPIYLMLTLILSNLIKPHWKGRRIRI